MVCPFGAGTSLAYSMGRKQFNFKDSYDGMEGGMSDQEYIKPVVRVTDLHPDESGVFPWVPGLFFQAV